MGVGIIKFLEKIFGCFHNYKKTWNEGPDTVYNCTKCNKQKLHTLGK